LTYYCRQFWAGAESMEAQARLPEMLVDIMLLAARSAQLSGEDQSRHFCADGVFCSTTCFRALLFASIYRLAVSAGAQLEETHQVALRAFARGVLGLLLGASSLLPLLGCGHGVADVVLALLLAPLVYTCPAIAAVAGQLADTNPQGGSDLTSDNLLAEVGHVDVPPFCLACGGLDGVYTLSRHPVRKLPPPESRGGPSRSGHSAPNTILEQLRKRAQQAEERLSSAQHEDWLRAERSRAAAEQRVMDAVSERALSLAHRAERQIDTARQLAFGAGAQPCPR